MIAIKINNDFGSAKAWLKGVREKQIPFATALALTRTAQDVRKELRTEISRVFDRPTNFTLNSLYLQPAKKTNLEAKVWLRDNGFRPHYLIPQIEGGARPQKRFEQRLVRIGVMTPNQRAVPAQGATLDSHGNMSRGQIVKILSQLGSAGFQGDYSTASNSRRSKAKRQKEAYFVASSTIERTRHLHPGIYVRLQRTGYSVIKPVLMFVNRATYRKRFDFYGVAQRVVAERWDSNFNQAMAQAVATAR